MRGKALNILTIRAMQNKTAVRCTHIRRMPTIERETRADAGEDTEQLELVQRWRECKSVWPLWNAVWDFLRNVTDPVIQSFSSLAFTQEK